MLRPRSSSSVFNPRSVSSFAAHPPEMPDPTTIASYSVDSIAPRTCWIDGALPRVERHRGVPGEYVARSGGCRMRGRSDEKAGERRDYLQEARRARRGTARGVL